ncbi:hypothetical protein JW872_00545 [Candidatus Babeliales bacterium]|nr:hypothetical protein [Candidatus Babeliales bacterium]
MAREQRKRKVIPQAQLFIGRPDTLEAETISYLQRAFCQRNGCSICTTCTQLHSHSHHAVLWLAPERTYTVEQLEPIFERAVFALDNDEHFFFVLYDVDRLTPACANRLLKLIEEPPPGYHFLLQAQRLDLVLPTIRSRCMTTTYYSQQEQTQTHTLFPYFTSALRFDPGSFSKTLETSKITEHESELLINDVLAYWIAAYNFKPHAITAHIVHILQRHLKRPIMPGSSKLVIRTLFLDLAPHLTLQK